MSHHLGYPAGADKPTAATNHRNGKSGKTVFTDDGPVRIEAPSDRAGEFEPKLIGKHDRRCTGFDDKMIAMYARGMTVRETARVKVVVASFMQPTVLCQPCLTGC